MIGILSQVSAVAAGSLVAAVWEGLVLAGCVALVLRVLPGVSAAARSLVWSAAMLAVVALPFVHFGAASAAGTGHVVLDERLSLALVGVWAALSFWRAVELVRSAVYLRSLARGARSVDGGPEVAALLAEGRYGDSGFARMTARFTRTSRRRVELCASDEVDRPSVVGFLRPRILVPAALLERLSEGELEQIVLHEMEHLRRRDDWTNLLQKLALVLFPLNPALVWIERRLCLERELACDDQVLRVTRARKAYAACLANLAEHTLVRRGVSLALGAWERRPELVRRVHRILSRPAEEMGRRQAFGVVGTVVVALVAGARWSGACAAAGELWAGGGLVAASVEAPLAARGFGYKAQDVVFRPRAVKAVPSKAQVVRKVSVVVARRRMGRKNTGSELRSE